MLNARRVMALDKDTDLSWLLALVMGQHCYLWMKIQQRKSESRKNFVKYN